MDVKNFNLYHMNLKKLFFCFYFLVLSHWSYCQHVEKGDQFVTLGYGVLSLYELGAFGDAMARVIIQHPK